MHVLLQWKHAGVNKKCRCVTSVIYSHRIREELDQQWGSHGGPFYPWNAPRRPFITGNEHKYRKGVWKREKVPQKAFRWNVLGFFSSSMHMQCSLLCPFWVAYFIIGKVKQACFGTCGKEEKLVCIPSIPSMYALVECRVEKNRNFLLLTYYVFYSRSLRNGAAVKLTW